MKITQAVQSFLDSSRIREVSKKEKKFYLSDMGKCLRMRWFKRKGIESEFAPHVNWIFKIGDLYHDFVYKALESQGLLLASEDYIENDHFIGKYDGIVEDEDGKAVIDIKSAPAYKINQVVSGKDDEQLISQILSYQMMLEEQGEKGLVKSILLFVNKEPSDKDPVIFFEKHYHLTSWRKRQLKEEMDTLAGYWEKDKVPPCTCPAWMKNYNAFQPLCAMKDDGIKQILKELKKGKRFISDKSSLYLVEGNNREEVATAK